MNLYLKLFCIVAITPKQMLCITFANNVRNPANGLFTEYTSL